MGFLFIKSKQPSIAPFYPKQHKLRKKKYEKRPSGLPGAYALCSKGPRFNLGRVEKDSCLKPQRDKTVLIQPFVLREKNMLIL